MGPLSIRAYEERDWDAVCRVHDAARPHELRGLVPPESVLPMAAVAEVDGFFRAQTFVAIRAGSVVGFVSSDPPELTWLYVHPEHQGRGVGRRLVEKALPLLGSDGHVLCVATNLRAVRLYESCGFVVAARFPGEVDGFPCTCLRLCLPGSVQAEEPPRPTHRALALAGFPEDRPGSAVRDRSGVWIWVGDADR